jgi:hypothetical protein
MRQTVHAAPRRVLLSALIAGVTTVCVVLLLVRPIVAQEIGNERFRVRVDVSKDGPVVEISRTDEPGVTRRIAPSIDVLFADGDPGYASMRIAEEVTLTAGWKRSPADADPDLFHAATPQRHRATSVARGGARDLVFRFDAARDYELGLRLELPAGQEAPVIETSILPRKEGWYSAAFSGITPQDPAKVDFLFQPLVWSWKRFPARSYLTPETFATTAATFVTAADTTEGLAADLSEMPYRYATFTNSRFGFVLRDGTGQARPLLFAPVLGGAESKRRAGERFTFRARYVLAGGGWYGGVQYILRDIARYRNERQNGPLSLNQTLENMIAFGMNDGYSGWVQELKGFDYRFDVPGTVKVVSALHALGVALVTGDTEVYRRRALPLIEYVMSREKYLYSTNEAETSQNPSHFLRGPCVEIGELASLFEITGGKSVVFRREAERIVGKPRRLNLLTDTGGGTWQDQLAMFRITHDASWLTKARAGADAHIAAELDRLPAGFDTNPALLDKQAAFYTDYGPRWFDLYELYEATNDRRYLDAAVTSARAMLPMLRSNPMAPDIDILANEGGKVPGIFPGRRVTGEKWEERDTTTNITEERVPAWRTSLVGLPPEQGGTYLWGPIMLTHHAAWLLRLAHHAKDDLLRDAAVNAVIGRYANFPGYYFTSLATTVYQKADYPLHSYYDIKYNAIFYNHVWPHIALLVDYLVSDAFYRSGGQIDFPSAYAPGYAYLTSKVYGHRLGRVFGDEGVALWMPRGAITASTTAVNHLFGVGKNDLYLILMNTAPNAEQVQIRVNADVVAWNADREYPVSWLGGSSGSARLTRGELSARIAPYGLAVAKIQGLTVDTSFQRRVATPPAAAPSDQSYARIDSGVAAIGTVTGMRISVVPELADVFVYLDATEKQAREVRFRYRIGDGAWTDVRDETYPFELSVHVPKPEQAVEVQIEALDRDNRKHAGPRLRLTP